MTDGALSLESRPEGTVLSVLVTPKASRTDLRGVREGALRVAVQAPPERGKANLAMLKFLAARLALPRSRLTLLSGATTRAKRVLVSGVEPEAVRARLV